MGIANVLLDKSRAASGTPTVRQAHHTGALPLQTAGALPLHLKHITRIPDHALYIEATGHRIHTIPQLALKSVRYISRHRLLKTDTNTLCNHHRYQPTPHTALTTARSILFVSWSPFTFHWCARYYLHCFTNSAVEFRSYIFNRLFFVAHLFIFLPVHKCK